MHAVPQEAAALFLAAVDDEYSGRGEPPLPQPLDKELVTESLVGPCCGPCGRACVCALA